MPDLDRRDETQQTQRIPWWLWPHVLSLEAPIVAMLWQAILARSHRVALMPATSVGLALSVWLIYVIDRLLDGARADEATVDVRHRFYRTHWRFFVFFAIPLAMLSQGWIALFVIPQGLLWHCLALGMLIGIYLACFPARRHHRIVGALGGLVGLFVIVAIFALPMEFAPKIQLAVIGLMMMTFGFFHRLDKSGGNRIPKEPLGALLFALGCSAGVQFFSMSDGVFAVSIDVMLLWLAFGMNMIGISRFEKDSGVRDQNSVAVVWPDLMQWYPLLLLGGIVVCVWIAIAPSGLPSRTGQLSGSVGVSMALLVLLWWRRARLSPLSYRVLADLALVVPGFALLFS